EGPPRTALGSLAERDRHARRVLVLGARTARPQRTDAQAFGADARDLRFVEPVQRAEPIVAPHLAPAQPPAEEEIEALGPHAGADADGEVVRAGLARDEVEGEQVVFEGGAEHGEARGDAPPSARVRAADDGVRAAALARTLAA